MNLYEIDNQIEKLIDQLFSSVDEETGEINADIKAELDAMQETRDEKLKNIAFYIKNLEADALALKTEAAKLTARQKSAENHAKRLRDYLIANLTEADEKKFTSEDAIISFAIRESTAVNITDIDKLPKKYLVKSVEFKPDKKAIGEMLKAKKKVAGAELVINRSINFK